MAKTFKFTRAPYDEGDNLYKKATFVFEPGVTVLVGCNGAGKTTLFHQIKDQLQKEGVPVLSFDNLKEGGGHAVSSAGFYGDFNFMATAMTSSEGENIVMNIGKLASNLRGFMENGEVKGNSDALARAFAKAMWENDKEDEKEMPNERWLLLDAIDSGLSVDNIVDLKKFLFKTILDDQAGKRDVYIICSANEYELCNGERCFDVQNAKYIEFKNYDEYREFVLKTREIKDKRFNK